MSEITKEQKLSLLDEMQKEYESVGYPFDDDPVGLEIFHSIIKSIRADIDQPAPKVVTREQVRLAFERSAIPLTDYEDNPLALFSENVIPFLSDLGFVVEKKKS